MKITYTLYSGANPIGLGLIANSVDEINNILDELKKLDQYVKPSVTILKVENGDK